METKHITKYIAVTQIATIFVVPVLLIYFGIINSEWRLFVLLLCSLILYGITAKERWTAEDMGIRMDNIKKAFWPYFIFTILGIGFIFLIHALLGMADYTRPEDLVFKLSFFLPISFLQEFAYRSFLLRKLETLLKNKREVILVNAFLFMILHMIYPDPRVMLLVTFIGGIAFSWIYMKHPNLWLIGLSHSAINITAVLLGFFVV